MLQKWDLLSTHMRPTKPTTAEGTLIDQKGRCVPADISVSLWKMSALGPGVSHLKVFRSTYFEFQNSPPSRAKAYPCLLMATALPSAEVPLLTIRTTQSTIAAASLPVPSLISSSIGTLSLSVSFCCHLIFRFSDGDQTYPVGQFLTALRSVIENPSTSNHTTPTKNCDVMTIMRIRGRWRRG